MNCLKQSFRQNLRKLLGLLLGLRLLWIGMHLGLRRRRACPCAFILYRLLVLGLVRLSRNIRLFRPLSGRLRIMGYQCMLGLWRLIRLDLPGRLRASGGIHVLKGRHLWLLSFLFYLHAFIGLTFLFVMLI